MYLQKQQFSGYFSVWKNIKGKAMSDDYDDDHLYDECE
jgi:hypothetical protein